MTDIDGRTADAENRAGDPGHDRDRVVADGDPTPPNGLDDDRSGESLGRRAWRRFRRHRLAMTGLIVLATMIVLAVLAPFVTTHDPNAIDLADRSSAPSWDHWLGTDRTGRDVWARLVYGSRVSLSVGLVAVALSTLIGVTIGSMAGFFRGAADMVLMRLADTVMTFPSLVVIIVLVAVVGPSVYNAMFAIGVMGWPAISRIVRGEVLSLRERPFITAARAIGLRRRTIVTRHIFPNTVSSIAVAVTLGVGTAILQESALSFLGLGVQIPTASWGNMLQDAQSVTVLEEAPWMWIPPGAAIALAVVSINFIGDGLRDALDPRSQL